MCLTCIFQDTQRQLYLDTHPFPYEDQFFKYEITLAIEKHFKISNLLDTIIQKYSHPISWEQKQSIRNQIFHELTKKILSHDSRPHLRKIRSIDIYTTKYVP